MEGQRTTTKTPGGITGLTEKVGSMNRRKVLTEFTRCLIQMYVGTPAILTEILGVFLSTAGKFRDNTSIRQNMLSSKSLPIHYLPITLPFDNIKGTHRVVK